MPTVEVTLLSRPDCHLCDVAREIITSVVEEFPNAYLTERSVDDDAGLKQRYTDEVPVVLIDGQVHTIWRVDSTRLRVALTDADSRAH